MDIYTESIEKYMLTYNTEAKILDKFMNILLRNIINKIFDYHKKYYMYCYPSNYLELYHKEMY